MPKELVYVDSMYSIHFLVPKKRGDGWVKTPIWHNSTAITEKLMDIPGVRCVCGLDGSVDIDFSPTPAIPVNRDEVRAQIEKIYGLPMRHDPERFWSVLKVSRAEKGD